VDNTKPVISNIPSNMTVYSNNGNTSSCSQTATWSAPTALDNCGGTLTGTPSAAPGSVFTLGTTTVTYTFTDASNNVSTCSFDVTVIDNTKPVISNIPSNITLNSNTENPLSCTQVATWSAPTATDNCGGTINMSSDYTSGQSFPVGTTTVNYTFTDLANNVSTTSFTVTVVDDTKPVISGAPSSMTVYSNDIAPTSCCQVVSWLAPSATDNCGGTVSVTTSTAPGSVFTQGTTTVTYTFNDA
jgi:hypothetical protein